MTEEQRELIVKHIEVRNNIIVSGQTGCGKTTLVKLLLRLYDVTDGEILLNGVNIKEYDYDEYMSVFAPVFQDFQLHAFTIRENIAFDERAIGNSVFSSYAEAEAHLLQQPAEDIGAGT